MPQGKADPLAYIPVETSSFSERYNRVASPNMPAVILVLLLLVAFIAAGLNFGFVQALLPVAIAASMSILSAFLLVASSKDAH
jgi:hypothetical protein